MLNIPRTGIKYKKWQAYLKLVERGHKPTEWVRNGCNWYLICTVCQNVVHVDKGGHKRASGKALHRFCEVR